MTVSFTDSFIGDNMRRQFVDVARTVAFGEQLSKQVTGGLIGDNMRRQLVDVARTVAFGEQLSKQVTSSLISDLLNDRRADSASVDTAITRQIERQSPETFSDDAGATTVDAAYEPSDSADSDLVLLVIGWIFVVFLLWHAYGAVVGILRDAVSVLVFTAELWDGIEQNVPAVRGAESLLSNALDLIELYIISSSFGLQRL